MIWYYLKVNPDLLSDKEWAKAYQSIFFVRQLEAKYNENIT